MINYKKKLLEEIIRVDHAGELGAKYIYLGQLFVLKGNKKIENMYEQEIEHLEFFEKALYERRIRPSLLTPLWATGGFIMGAVSAALGYKGAMACTQAVEDVIEKHYQEQLNALSSISNEQKLRNKIKKFRDDEIEHKDLAISNEASKAPLYGAIFKIVGKITRTAIHIAKKV